jgi:hypothetical protein
MPYRDLNPDSAHKNRHNQEKILNFKTQIYSHVLLLEYTIFNSRNSNHPSVMDLPSVARSTRIMSPQFTSKLSNYCNISSSTHFFVSRVAETNFKIFVLAAKVSNWCSIQQVNAGTKIVTNTLLIAFKRISNKNIADF